MRISEIAAVLQKAAVDMQAFAANNDDFDFPDQVVLPFVMNFLTDGNAIVSGRILFALMTSSRSAVKSSSPISRAVTPRPGNREDKIPTTSSLCVLFMEEVRQNADVQLFPVWVPGKPIMRARP